MTPMPGTLANIVPAAGDPGAIMRMMKDLQRQIDEMRSAIPSAITSRNFDGTTNPLVPGTQGWALDSAGDADFSGDTTIGGNLVVGGTLSLPNGIINNAALANPIVATSNQASASPFALPVITNFAVGGTVRATVNFTVPTGFTQAIVLASVNDSAINSTASDDYLYSFLTVSGTGGRVAYSPSATTPAGKSAAATLTVINLVTGLTGGGTITIQSRPGTGNGAWASNASNGTSVATMALFLR